MTHTDEGPPRVLTSRFEQALLLAAEWHRPQRRKGSGTPYLAHLLGVASLALEFGATEDEAVAALLHDALEDGPVNTGLHPQQIRAHLSERFGEDVLAIVEACTDDSPNPGESKRPWRQRKDAYVRALKAKPESARLVAASDKLYNARAILTDVHAHGNSVFGRFSASTQETLWYYRAVTHALRPQGGERAEYAHLVAELTRTVDRLVRRALPATVVLLGPPGVGKGTVGENFARGHGWRYLSTGEELRGRKDGTFDEAMRSGGLVADDVVNGIVEDAIASERPLLLDGYPRNVEQAEHLTARLHALGRSAAVVVLLTAGEDTLMQRLLGRSGALGRADDNEETIRRRFDTYRLQTRPLVEHYGEQGALREIDGEGTPEEVAARLAELLS
jgi:adenylate kinase family enzyme/5'-deoxynucleotidase YfbR-like HD superfamily hydrolase